MKIRIKIQSYSDIITNSSSELFCRVYCNESLLQDVRKALMCTIWDCCESNHVTIQTTTYNHETDDYEKSIPYVEWNIDYGVCYDNEFLQKAVINWLNEKIGVNNYTIEF